MTSYEKLAEEIDNDNKNNENRRISNTSELYQRQTLLRQSKNSVSSQKTNLLNMLWQGDKDFVEYMDSKDPDELNTSQDEHEDYEIIDKPFIINAISEEKTEKQIIDELVINAEKRSITNAASVKSSIFSVCSLAVGAGSLSLPSMVDNMGLVLALVMLTLSALAAYWTLTLMIKASLKMGVYNYSELLKKTLGKWASVMFDITILIYVFGVILSFEVISSGLYDTVFEGPEYKNLPDFLETYWDQAYLKYPISYGFNALLIIPLCLIKDVSKMKIVSLIGIVIIVFVILVVVIQSPFYIIHNIQEGIMSNPNINWIDISRAFKVDTLWFFKGTAVFFFGFTCHTGIFPIYSNLRNNQIRRVNMLFKRSISLIYIIYLLISVCGFLSIPIKCPDLIVFRTSIFEHDYFMTAAKFGMIFTLSMGIPVNYNAFRMSFFQLFWGTNEVHNLKNFCVTIPFIIICNLVGLLYSQVLSYLSIIGGFCSVIICFAFPGILYLKTNDNPKFHWKNIVTSVLIFLLCSTGITAGIKTILDS